MLVPLLAGKQVISSLLFGLTGDLPEPACFMDVERKAKVSAKMWSESDKLPGNCVYGPLLLKAGHTP